MNNFDKEFNSKWELFLKTKNTNDLYALINHINKCFHDHLDLEPHEAIKTLPNKILIDDSSTSTQWQSEQQEKEQNVQQKELTTEEFLLAFNWPDLDHLFYFFNEELANLNRRLLTNSNNSNNNNRSTNNLVQLADSDNNNNNNSEIFMKFLSLLKCVFILSKNMICLNLIINTSLVNQFLSSYSYILNMMYENESIRDYFQFLCFLLIKAHDPYLCWFRKYFNFDPRYVKIKPLQVNNQRQFSFKFDANFFSFLFDSLKLIKDDKNGDGLTKLGIHTYACILNEISSSNPSPPASLSSNSLSNLNENLIKCIQPPIIDYLFQQLLNDNDNNTSESYMILNDKFVSIKSLKRDDANLECFDDAQLIVCRVLPHIVNILHLSLPDKRLVELGAVLDKILVAVERVKRDFIKLELVKSYLTMLSECSDRAALKVAIVSRRFFVCLLEQVRLTCLTHSSSGDEGNTDDHPKSTPFLHEFVRVVLNLIKHLLDNSQPVKDIFSECSCYELLFEILKECPSEVLDIEISMLINEMISESNSSATSLRKDKIMSSSSSYLDKLENSEMAVLLIKLLPYMKKSAQEFSLTNICRLCTSNLKNQSKSCKNSMLLNLIKLLNHHTKFNQELIDMLFRTIKLLGRYSIRQNELFEMFALLQPKNRFPYGIDVLRCLNSWSKSSASIGMNLTLFEVQSATEVGLGNSTAGSGSGSNLGGFVTSGEQLDRSPTTTTSTAMLLPSSALTEYNLTDSAKLRRTSLVTINQNVLMNMMKSMGTGALSQNAQQQAKYFFDFQQHNSGIRVPSMKKWPGHAFTFHCWMKLRSDLDTYEKKRRQLYSFYTDKGEGFEAFFTADCSSLVVSVCTRKEFLSVQLRELDFDASDSTNRQQQQQQQSSPNQSPDTTTTASDGEGSNMNTTSTSDYWHSITIVHVPAKKPFGYSQVCVYIDGVLKKEADLKMPSFSDGFSQIRLGAACSRPNTGVVVGSQAQSASSYVSSTLTAPFSGLKSVFGLAYKSGANEKSLSVTTIPSGSQDTVWDAPTCLMGHLSSCFVLSDVISDLQVRLLYELGPNQYALNWLDIVEMSDIKSKMVLHYDAKCARDLTCYDLSHNRINGKFSGSTVSCDNFKESLNAIGSVQIFYPLLNYLSSNQEYLDLVLADWNANLAENNSSFTEQKMVKVNSRKSIFDDGELEKNIVSMMLNLVRHLFHNSDIMQDRFERNNGIALLGFLIQRLPRHFIDINLLRVCQDLVNEAANLSSKSLLNAIYEYLIFDFRIWNKADYEIRIGHIQYISTIIKDDRKYFRKKYGVQFFLDVIKTYFGSSASSTSTAASYKYSTSDMNQLDNQQLEDEDLRNLRSSFFGLIKYYAQKDVKVSEVNAILSFLSTTKVPQFQNDVLDVLINLLEAPSSSDQLYLLLFEPNMADAMWSLIAQMDELSEATERRLFKLIRVLLKTKKVYDKSKLRLRLDECGTFAGLTSKIAAEFSSKSLSSGDVQQQQRSAPLINENLVIELIETLMVDELHSANTNLSSSSTTNTQTQTASTTATTAVNYDNLWHILSLLTMSPVQLIANRETLIRARSKACDLVIKFFFAQHYNLSTTRALTKCPAWQDIICQMFCVERLPASILSPTTLSSQQRNAIVSNSSNPKFNAGNYDDEDVWENIEYQNETGGQASSTGAGANTSTSAAPAAAGIETTSDSMEEIIDDKLQQSTTDIDSQMTTSTPSNRRLMSNSENKHLATIHESNSNQEPVVTSTAEKPKSASSTNKSSRRVISFAEQQQQNLSSSSSSSKSASRFDLDDSMVMPIREREREASFSTAHSVKRTVSYAIDVEELGVEGAELYEKLMFILYKLVWDGVVGSNEDAWKERCQLFSSLRRLAKEFYLIKPIEQIEMRLLEMSVKYCVAEAKKTNYSYKEQSQVLENCRELIKLVDSFIDSHGDVSENLISATILLLDQIRVFDQKIPPTPQLSQQSAIANSAAQQQKLLNNTAPANYDSTSESSLSSGIKSSKLLRAFSTTSSSSSLASWSSSTSVLTLTPGDAAANNSGVTGTGGGTVPASLLSTYGIIHDEWAETSYLGMNILMNVLASRNVEICAQASAKINTILHNRTIASCEEAAYFIASVEKVIYERLNEGDEQNYAFLLPIMKCLLEKSHALLQMNVQVPNIPSFSASPSFYEDFKEYCKCDEWRIFMQKQVVPLRDQYLAMTVNPCQMNMKIWWNMCFETLMISIHKRMRSIGEAKIKFEDTLFNSWKERERLESMRYQNYLIMLKRNNLAMRKQLHTALKYLTGERGAWNEGSKEVYWMLSNHENRERMRCKLIENLKFDSHFEASRLRDHSGYPGPSYMMSSSSTAAQTAPSTATGDETAAATATPTIESSSAQNLAQKLSINKEAINAQIKEDVVGEEEFLVATPTVTTTNDSVVTSSSTSPSTATASSTSEQTQTVRSSDARSMSSNTSDSGLSRTSSLLSMNKPQQPPQPQIIAPLEPYEQFAQLEEKEKLLLKSDCELITVTRVVKGRFELTNKYIYFFDTFSPFYYEHTLNDSSSIAAGDNQPQAGYSSGGGGSGFSCQDFDILNDMKISLTQLKEVQLRRYNLRRSALEFFLVNEANFFINFNKATRNKLYGKIMSMKLPNLVSYPSVRTQVDLLKATDYTQKWVNHELSNFDYLMKLNTIAGRTYNDLSQYPIFPWILKDYTSEKLDLNDPNVYRDLSKPIGVQSKKNEDYVRAKYESFEDPTGTMRPFHYGTHYSNAANVMHYLIRLEPFTTLHIQLQSDRFDVADRQFHSIANTWRILYENPNDVKELIPEFFYLPEFLVNMNNFDFGELQMSRNKVNNVSLPRWAKSPEHFIHMHRRALESDYVSEHLHEWIDLIFGYKQQGVEAEKALNMFMYYSYEGALDLDAITDPVARRATEDMISNFGQTPTQLFKDAHPKRKSREQSIRDKIAMGKPVFLWHQINNLKAYYVEFCDPKRDNEPIDPIVFLSIPRHHTKSFMQQGLSDPLISVSQTGIVGVNGWQSNDRSLTNLFSFEKDPSLLSEKTKKSIAGPFDPNYEIDHRVFVLTHDSKLLISGAHWDNSLRVFSLSKYRTISQIYQHSNIVTCLAIDYTGSLLVSGSMDTTCMIWQVVQEYGSSVNLDTMPMHILYGHRACVTSVDICNELDLVVSAGLDGLINVHSIRSGSFVRSLSLHDTSLLLQPKSNATVTTSSSHPPQYRNLMVKLSNERHILVYACSSPSSLVENAASVANPVTSSTSATSLSGNDFQKKLIYEIFLFSINGNAICRERLNSPVQDMIIKNEHCILAVLAQSRSNTAASAANSSLNSSRIESDVSTSSSQLSSSSNSKQPSSKLVFKEMFDFKTIQTMRLKAPIKCMFLTSDEGHLLVSLQDGKLIVINGDKHIK